ncbi:6-bladed beta-propeller, partial [Parabacteroides goldsteinii]
MKSRNLMLGAILFILMGCGVDKSDSLITVDVTVNYPKKELVLQDFMDVEYIPLETTDEFVVKGKITDVGKDILVLTNVRQGEILIFDRSTGKGLKKINRRGQGPEEYILPFNVHLNK